MFGVLAFSEESFANQGLVLTGSQTIDANFTQTSAGNATFTTSQTVDANFTQTTAAKGLLLTSSDISFNFTQTSDAERLPGGIATMDANFTQTTDPNFTASGDATLDANFTQTSTQTRIRTQEATMDGNFTQTSDAIKIAYGLNESDLNFKTYRGTDDTTQILGGLTFSSGNLDFITRFDLTEALGGRLFEQSQTMNSVFIKTVDGDILWVKIDASGTPEAWTAITHTGDTWTEVNAGSTSETWTNRVV